MAGNSMGFPSLLNQMFDTRGAQSCAFNIAQDGAVQRINGLCAISGATPAAPEAIAPSTFDM